MEEQEPKPVIIICETCAYRVAVEYRNGMTVRQGTKCLRRRPDDQTECWMYLREVGVEPW